MFFLMKYETNICKIMYAPPQRKIIILKIKNYAIYKNNTVHVVETFVICNFEAYLQEYIGIFPGRFTIF